jgi:hypothetical protein
VPFKNLRARLTASVAELDRNRLHDRYTGLGVTPLDTAPRRVPVRVGGEVQAIQVVPRNGSPSVEVVVSDGHGKAVAVFTGRRRIAGMAPGRGVLLEGVGRDDRGRLLLLNPAYTLLAGASS